MKRYDLIVVGLGIYGSCIAAEAGSRGLRVLAVDQFEPPHGRGSSHGQSRIFRLTAVEAKEYVPVARRALDIWKNYDVESGQRVLSEAGFAIIEQPGSASRRHHGVSDLVLTAARFASDHAIFHELALGSQFINRFPGLSISPDANVYYEPGALVINADEAVRAALRRARCFSNVEIITQTKVHSVRSDANGVEVMTDPSILTANHAVLCTGPWRPSEQLGINFQAAEVLPQVTISRRASIDDLKDAHFPGFIYVADNMPLIYGIPPTHTRDEAKLGLEQNEVKVATPGEGLPPGFVDGVRAELVLAAERILPNVDMSAASPNICYYTVTADSKFHIVSDMRRHLTVVSCCSGHGFKYAPAFAEQIISLIAAAH